MSLVSLNRRIATMKHAFISYVREDEKIIHYVVQVLEKNGVEVWLDKDKIYPGLRWKQAIRNAINEGAFFVAMFSKNWEQKERTYANEELVLAIEQLRQRPTDRAWFIPVRLDECKIPDRDIGGGETISNIQYVDFPKDGWVKSLTRLLKALGVNNPILEVGEPLGTGLPSNVKLGYGRFVVGEIEPEMPFLKGSVFSITNGWVTRSREKHLIAYMETQAPNMELQKVNESFGLSNFFAISTDGFISDNPSQPNTFGFLTERLFTAGSRFWDIMSAQYVQLPCDVAVETIFEAKGLLSESKFLGTYKGEAIYDFLGNKIKVLISGDFDIAVIPDFDADPKLGNL
jgi:TIR domain